MQSTLSTAIFIYYIKTMQSQIFILSRIINNKTNYIAK